MSSAAAWRCCELPKCSIITIDDDPDVRTGVKIVRRALQEPLRRIAENAGVEGAVVVGEVEQLKGNKGFNAVTGEFEDLAAAGIIDPTKVVRTALQNAASIAGLLLTTDAAVTELPEPKKAGSANAGRRRLRLLATKAQNSAIQSFALVVLRCGRKFAGKSRRDMLLH